MTRPHRIARLAMVVASLVATGTPLVAQSPNDRGSLAITYGQLDGDGTSDRTFGSIAAEFPAATDYHMRLELAFQDREENAEFLGLGVERDMSDGGSFTLNLGTSNSDLGVYPEFLIGLGHEYAGPAERGLLFRSGISYSDYAGSAESVNLSGEVVRYFPPTESGSYFVGQVGGSVTLSDPGSEVGWDLNVAATIVNPGGWSYGASGSAGTIGYEGALALPVENDFIAIRPFVSRSLGDSAEITARGEFVDTEDFDLKGMSVGLNFNF